MTIKNWLYLASIIVSIVSVFLSNWLGQRAVIAKSSNEQKLKRYQNYYVPFMKFLYKTKPEYWNFYDLRTARNENLDGSAIYELSQLMSNNLEYMGKDLPPLIAHFNLIADERYSDIGVTLNSKFVNAPSLDDTVKGVKEVNALFDKIVVETLQEATQLARTLSLEPISEPLLASYLDEKRRRTGLKEKILAEQEQNRSS